MSVTDLKVLDASATAIAALPADGELAYVDGKTPQVHVWNSQTAQTRDIGGASGALRRLVISSDGTRLAAADVEGRVVLWNAMDGALVQQSETGTPVVALRFSGDGQQLVTADEQKRIRIYDSSSLRLLEELASPSALTDFAVSPDTRTVIAAGTEPAPLLIRRSLQMLIDAHQGPVAGVAVTSNGQFLVSGGEDKGVHLWNLADGQKVRSLAGVAQPVTSVAISQDNNRVAAGGADGIVHLWNLGDGMELFAVNHGAAVRDVSFSPDGTKLVTSGDDHIVRVWDTRTKLELQFFAGHAAPVAVARFQNDNRTLVSVSEDKTGRVWSLATLWATTAHDSAVRDMAVVGGGSQVLSCGADGRVELRNTGDGQRSREYPSTAGATAFAYRSDSTRMATAGNDGKVHIWNPGDGSPLAELDGPANVTAMTFSPDNQKLAVCGENRLFIYGLPAPQRPGVEWTLHQELTAETEFTDVVFAPDNRRLFATHVSGHVSEWNYAAQGPLRQFNHGGPVYGVAISTDNKTIVSCSGDQTVRVWDADTGQQRAQLNGHQGAVYGLALSPDAALALSAGADNTLRLWDIAGGRTLKQLPSGGATVYSIAINPQGTQFATGGGDRKLRLYDLLTGIELRTIEGHSDFVNRVTFTPNGDRLLSYGYAGHLMVWNPGDGAKLYATQIGRVGNFADYSRDGTRVVLANGNGEALVVTLPPEGR